MDEHEIEARQQATHIILMAAHRGGYAFLAERLNNLMAYLDKHNLQGTCLIGHKIVSELCTWLIFQAPIGTAAAALLTRIVEPSQNRLDLYRQLRKDRDLLVEFIDGSVTADESIYRAAALAFRTANRSLEGIWTLLSSPHNVCRKAEDVWRLNRYCLQYGNEVVDVDRVLKAFPKLSYFNTLVRLISFDDDDVRREASRLYLTLIRSRNAHILSLLGIVTHRPHIAIVLEYPDDIGDIIEVLRTFASWPGNREGLINVGVFAYLHFLVVDNRMNTEGHYKFIMRLISDLLGISGGHLPPPQYVKACIPVLMECVLRLDRYDLVTCGASESADIFYYIIILYDGDVFSAFLRHGSDILRRFGLARDSTYVARLLNYLAIVMDSGRGRNVEVDEVLAVLPALEIVLQRPDIDTADAADECNLMLEVMYLLSSVVELLSDAGRGDAVVSIFGDLHRRTSTSLLPVVVAALRNVNCIIQRDALRIIGYLVEAGCNSATELAALRELSPDLLRNLLRMLQDEMNYVLNNYVLTILLHIASLVAPDSKLVHDLQTEMPADSEYLQNLANFCKDEDCRYKAQQLLRIMSQWSLKKKLSLS